MEDYSVIQRVLTPSLLLVTLGNHLSELYGQLHFVESGHAIIMQHSCLFISYGVL